MKNQIISPKTKIYDLLEAYPELEDTLIALAPQFKKLKNPVLRKTITKITSLSQAAIIGGLNVEDLINKLRAEVGQSISDSQEIEGVIYTIDKPDWFDEDKISESIDIREMLNAGDQPVHIALSAIKNLNENEILKLIAPFIPAPLLDKSLSLDYLHWLDKKSEVEYWVYFKK